jgi:hypothetical protein
VLFRLQNPFIGLSVIWAYIGIILKRQDDYASIVIASVVAIAVVIGFTVWGFYQKNSFSII